MDTMIHLNFSKSGKEGILTYKKVTFFCLRSLNGKGSKNTKCLGRVLVVAKPV